MLKKIIFRQYDIRGIVPTDFDKYSAEIISNNFSHTLIHKHQIPSPTILIGRDNRISSESIREGVVAGLIKSGCKIIDIGVCPTPLTHFSARQLEGINATIMITGSHNPPEYNGLKLSVNNTPFHSEQLQDLYQFCIQNGVQVSKPKGSIKHVDMSEPYIRWQMEHFNQLASNISQLHRPIKIVIDAANATASILAPQLLRNLGIHDVPLFCIPDGSFPNHHPDPTIASNLSSLIQTVVEQKADMGIAFDGDSDRIGVVDASGRIIEGDELLYIFSKHITSKNPTPKIILDIKASQTIIDQLIANGNEVELWKSGHSHMNIRLNKQKADLAGEMSAHIFFADRFFGHDDALYAMLRLIEIYINEIQVNSDSSISNLLSDLPQKFSTPEIIIPCPDKHKKYIITLIKKELLSPESHHPTPISDLITIDGLRFKLQEGWALIRSSNTQPAITTRFEANSAVTLNQYKSFYLKMIHSYIKKHANP